MNPLDADQGRPRTPVPITGLCVEIQEIGEMRQIGAQEAMTMEPNSAHVPDDIFMDPMLDGPIPLQCNGDILPEIYPRKKKQKTNVERRNLKKTADLLGIKRKPSTAGNKPK